MDFNISSDQKELRDLTRSILTDHATHDRFKALEKQSRSIFDRELWKRLAEVGVTGIVIPEAHGGLGLGFLDLAVVLEEIGRFVAPVPSVAVLALGALPVARHAPAEIQSQLLPGIASGELLVTTALTEPGEPDPLAPTTRATKDGDTWTITGEKAFVPYGAEVDWLVVPATVQGGAGDGSVVLLLVSGTAEGLARTDLVTTNRQPQADLSFAGVVASGVIAEGEGAREALEDIRLHATSALCSLAAGLTFEAVRMTARYTSERIQFDKPIAAFQAVGQRAADAYIDAELVRLTALQAAWRLSEGLPAADEVAIAKFWAGEGSDRALHAAQHLHGGIGVDTDYPLHRYFVWGKAVEHELGTPTRQLLALGKIIASTPV